MWVRWCLFVSLSRHQIVFVYACVLGRMWLSTTHVQTQLVYPACLVTAMDEGVRVRVCGVCVVVGVCVLLLVYSACLVPAMGDGVRVYVCVGV